MLTINHSTATILRGLLASDGSVELGEMSNALGCTVQLLRYHVAALDSSLRIAGMGSVSVCGSEIVCQFHDREGLQSLFDSRDTAGYVFTKEERQDIALLSIGLLSSPTTLGKMCDLFGVSRNTALADIAALRRRLESHNVQLASNGRYGYMLKGEERELRYLLVEALWDLDPSYARNRAQSMLDDELLDLIADRGGNDAAIPVDSPTLENALRSIVAEAEHAIPGRLTYNSVGNVVSYLQIVALRNHKGGICAEISRFSSVNLGLRGTTEHTAACAMVRAANARGVSIQSQESSYLAAVLLSSCVYALDALNEAEERTVSVVVRKLVDAFEQQACVRFSDRDGLVRRLLPHARAMLYRLLYRIKFHTQIAQIVIEHFRAVYDFTRLACDSVGRDLSLSFSEEEVACVSVYFGSWLCQDEPSEAVGARRILIVCGAGVGTSLLIRRQLQELLGGGYYYELKNRREISGMNFAPYDLVIATADVPGLPEGTIRVSALLTKAQAQSVVEWSVCPTRETLTPAGDVMSIVERHARVEDAPALIRDLQAFFNGSLAMEGGQPLRLLDVLTARRVQFRQEPCTSSQAIRIGCAPLVRDGVVTEGYADKVIALIDELGTYSELREGILVAHAEPGSEILRVGMSLTIFARPVSFERWERSYRVIFTLAAVDHDAHFPVMEDLMELLSSEETCETLRTWPDDTPEALYLYLTTCLESRRRD